MKKSSLNDSLRKRAVIKEIAPFLDTNDIIVIHGARQVGKTSILMYLKLELESKNKKVLYIDLEDGRYVKILDHGIDEFLTYLREEGHNLNGFRHDREKLYIMIDEIQYLENPSSFLKLLADHHRYLKVIVSGSSSFEMKSKFKNSLVGRTVNFEIYPLSFIEFLNFKGISFQTAPRYTEKKNAELQLLYTEFVLYGGYPKIALTDDVGIKERYLQQIIDTYIRKDIRDLADIKDVDKFNRLVEILASQSGSLLNIAELSNTCNLARPTIERYLFLLEQTYIIRLVRPFSRNVRTELTKTPKVYFYDPGLLQMLWLKRLQREILGSVFETSVFTELVKKYGRDSVYYWRTTDKKEIDFVLRQPGYVLPIEAKLRFPRVLPTALNTFTEAYPTLLNESNPFKLVALHGRPEAPGMIYPWQL